jgi:hypothetical protein
MAWIRAPEHEEKEGGLWRRWKEWKHRHQIRRRISVDVYSGGTAQLARNYSCALRNVSGLLNVFAIPSPRFTFLIDTFPVATAAPSCT